VSTMHVELVSPERNVWSGDATAVSARTLSGEIGILPRHEPVLAALGAGTVRITSDDGVTVVAVDGGFLSVDASGVRVLAETAVLAEEIPTRPAHVAPARSSPPRTPDPGRRPGPVALPHTMTALRVAELVVVVAAVLIALGVGSQALRWRYLFRHGACLGCSLRRPDGSFVSGLARYDADALRWFRSLGLNTKATSELPRTAFEVQRRREPDADEARSLGTGVDIVELVETPCPAREGAARTITLALPRESVLGFLAWLESSPPGAPGPLVG
jgi:F-type H+-transporting ATPase subunit epsilon